MNFGMILTVSGVATKKDEKVFEGKTKRTLKVPTLGGLKFLRAEAPRLAAGDRGQRRAA